MSGRGNSYVGSDHRTRVARAQGYPARSVLKLEEIDKKYGLLRVGQRVVDLGAAPGSWSLYVARAIGEAGSLLSVDLQEIEQKFPDCVSVLQCDAFDLSAEAHQAAGPYDVVLSDMAPNTGGSKSQNAARSFDLFCSALGVAQAFGQAHSAFVAKLFMGAEFSEAKKRVVALYKSCKIVKPRGTRASSVEVFLVGLDKRLGPNDAELVEP